MKKYAVIGASSGTGLQITRLLAARQQPVRAISRRPVAHGPFIDPVAADVTDPASIAQALDSDFAAVFYTVDIHQRRASREAVRAVMYEGAVNVMQALQRQARPPRFVLLSVIGPDRPSWVWWLLNALKKGMQQNIRDREAALQGSGLPHVILRAPRLIDGGDAAIDGRGGFDESAGDAAAQQGAGWRLHAAPPSQLRLDMKRTLARAELARAMVAAADHAPNASVWDVYAAAHPSEPATASAPSWLIAGWPGSADAAVPPRT